ncbi:MAG TPA: hypothetical protein ENN69_02520 [Spirochaetia bacterium]|nr:hypothetical protein [Spirochaetia bacterium]
MAHTTYRPNILTPHLGFFCDAPKRAVAVSTALSVHVPRSFFLQCLENNYPHPNSEAWETVREIPVQQRDSVWGPFLVGEFDDYSRPGFYRVITANAADYSYPFLIHDDAYRLLPSALLEYLHAQRCGEAVPGYHGPCHLDDGIRSDNSAPLDTVGGWHDAGDLRKWMAYTTLPILGLSRLRTVYGFSRTHFTSAPAIDDVVAEIRHGIEFILKMQDPESGMIFEDVGGGKVLDPRKPWWVENFSGVAASNQDNRFTDNLPASGDERTVRIQYNPLVQWLSLAVVEEAASLLADVFPDTATRARQAAARILGFMERRSPEEQDEWTVVLSWKVTALTAAGRTAPALLHLLETAVTQLLALQEQPVPGQSGLTGFWRESPSSPEPFRTPVYAAGPVIALLEFQTAFPDHALAGRAGDALRLYFDRYLFPLAADSPFRLIPYGLYRSSGRGQDRFHPAGKGLYYRHFIPTDTTHGIVIGLSGHLLSHAYSLALAARVFGETRFRDLALAQIEWITGCNPDSACLIYGFGFNNPVPHSRFLGPLPGGVYNGYTGDADDRPVLDTAGRLEWNSTEFWNPHCAHLMAALAYLLPRNPAPEHRIGVRLR